MKPMFSPSLMCMNLMDIKNQIEILDKYCDMYHADIMDGHFVKNITLSPDFVKAVSLIAEKPIDCHLMVTNPEDYIEILSECGAAYISPHVETINGKAFRLFEKIKSVGCKVGVVLNPETPISSIIEFAEYLDKITIMTVDPGFAGQTFIRPMLNKISQAMKMKEKESYNYIIEVDGSCNQKTFGELAHAGTEMFVVGSSGLFNLDGDLEKAWKKMTEIFKAETEKEGKNNENCNRH